MGRGRAFEKGNPGKPKGAVNKINADVRQFVLDVAQKFQDDPKKSLDSVDSEVFWSKIFPKIIPKDINVKLTAWVRTLSDEDLDKQIEKLNAELAEKKSKLP